jgi:HSP20 family protein
MISRYDPFRDVVSLRRAMDDLFEQSFVHPLTGRSGSSSMMAPMDVSETANGYEIDVALPGVKPEDIELTVHENTLSIRGHYSHRSESQDQPQSQTQATQEQQQASTGTQTQKQNAPTSTASRSQRGRTWMAREITSGSFERSVTLPKPINADNIQTKFENGILMIQAPVSEASRPRRINITGSQSQSQQQTIDSSSSQSSSSQGQ